MKRFPCGWSIVSICDSHRRCLMGTHSEEKTKLAQIPRSSSRRVIDFNRSLNRNRNNKNHSIFDDLLGMCVCFYPKPDLSAVGILVKIYAYYTVWKEHNSTSLWLLHRWWILAFSRKWMMMLCYGMASNLNCIYSEWSNPHLSALIVTSASA